MTKWRIEPNHVDFEAHGLKCAMRRAGRGQWCGYVGVPTSHYLHGAHHDNSIVCDIEVHGGLTWSDGTPANAPFPQGGLWWFGFDCAHMGDVTPYDAEQDNFCCFDSVYRDQEYVMNECHKLAEQLSKITTTKEEK